MNHHGVRTGLHDHAESMRPPFNVILIDHTTRELLSSFIPIDESSGSVYNAAAVDLSRQ